MWKGPCCLTSIEDGEPASLTEYENGEGDGGTITLLRPSVGQAVQKLLGLLFEFKYGKLGFMDGVAVGLPSYIDGMPGIEGVPPLQLILQAEFSILQVISAKAALELSLQGIGAELSNGTVANSIVVMDSAPRQRQCSCAIWKIHRNSEVPKLSQCPAVSSEKRGDSPGSQAPQRPFRPLRGFWLALASSAASGTNSRPLCQRRTASPCRRG